MKPRKTTKRTKAQDRAAKRSPALHNSPARLVRRRNNTQAPIVLNRKRTVELPAEFSSSAIPEPIDTILNTETILTGAGFTPEEVELLQANHLDRVSFCDIPQHLHGWTHARVDRVRKSVAKKMQAISSAREVRKNDPSEIVRSIGSSIHVCVPEQLFTGHSVYSFASVLCEPAFITEIGRARAKSLMVRECCELPESPSFRPVSRRAIFIMTVTVDQAAIDREAAALIAEEAGRWRSEEAIKYSVESNHHALARQRAEEAEQARVAALTRDQAKVELAAIEARITNRRLRKQDVGGSLQKERARHAKSYASGKREMSDYLKSGIPELESELESVESELGDLHHQARRLREHIHYCDSVRVRVELRAALIDPKKQNAITAARRALEELASLNASYASESIHDPGLAFLLASTIQNLKLLEVTSNENR